MSEPVSPKHPDEAERQRAREVVYRRLVGTVPMPVARRRAAQYLRSWRQGAHAPRTAEKGREWRSREGYILRIEAFLECDRLPGALLDRLRRCELEERRRIRAGMTVGADAFGPSRGAQAALTQGRPWYRPILGAENPKVSTAPLGKKKPCGSCGCGIGYHLPHCTKCNACSMYEARPTPARTPAPTAAKLVRRRPVAIKRGRKPT